MKEITIKELERLVLKRYKNIKALEKYLTKHFYSDIYVELTPEDYTDHEDLKHDYVYIGTIDNIDYCCDLTLYCLSDRQNYIVITEVAYEFLED